MPEGALAVPDHRVDRGKAEFDWYYQLSPADRKRVLKHCKPGGLAPDTCAHAAGFDYVDEWADALLAAVLGRVVADDGWDEARTLEASEALVGPHEVASMCGVPQNTVRQWLVRRVLPPAWCVVSGTPIWPRADIEEWGLRTKRLAVADAF